jgi:sugar lactone lactonase YvrE
VAEGADVPLAHTAVGDASSRCPPEVCVGAVLGDALRRVAVLGGREGMARSLRSAYGGSVTRFLGGSLRGVERRVITMPGVKSSCNGIAVSGDGSMLLVSDNLGSTHGLHVFSVADGSQRHAIYGADFGRQMWIAADGFVFVALQHRNQVQVLTPRLERHSVVGAGDLSSPAGVCANADVVVVSDGTHHVTVFNRSDGALLRRFGGEGAGDGQLSRPCGLCFLHSDRHVAVADSYNSRVSVFSIYGEFVRHVGVGELRAPQGVACSAFDELVVADTGKSRVVVFSSSGELLMTLGCGRFTGVSIHGGAIFAQDLGSRCVVFE